MGLVERYHIDAVNAKAADDQIEVGARNQRLAEVQFDEIDAVDQRTPRFRDDAEALERFHRQAAEDILDELERQIRHSICLLKCLCGLVRKRCTIRFI